jgi:hypothetical protein
MQFPGHVRASVGGAAFVSNCRGRRGSQQQGWRRGRCLLPTCVAPSPHRETHPAAVFTLTSSGAEETQGL